MNHAGIHRENHEHEGICDLMEMWFDETVNCARS